MVSGRSGRAGPSTVRFALAALLVFATGVAARFAPRHWTPLPFNSDGFLFAAQAERAATDGHLALESISSYGLGFPVLLSQLQLVTDASALSIAQPAIAVIGTVPCLFAFAFARRIARGCGWTADRTFATASVAGLVLATEGLYLRRTAAVSYEVVGILLVVVCAVAFHRLLQTRRSRWLIALAPCLAVLPVTHHLSTMMTALALTALAITHVHRTPDRSTVARGLTVVGLFWAYAGTYYFFQQPPYFLDLKTRLGVFVAFLVVLAGLVVSIRRATPRTLRLTFALPFAVGFAILAINAVTNLLPRTPSTHATLLVYAAPLAAGVALAVWGFPTATENADVGPIVLALFVGPLVFVGFGFAGGLALESSNFAARGQTFLHLSVVLMAAVTVADLGWRIDPRLQPVSKTTLPTILLVCAVASMPLAFAGPPTLAFQSTTTTEEFQAVSFANDHLDVGWTSDQHLTRVGNWYYSAGASPGPTYEWLRGTDPPDRPVIIQGSWSSDGALAFPGDPIVADDRKLNQFETGAQIVYDVGPGDETTIVLPAERTEGCP